MSASLKPLLKKLSKAQGSAGRLSAHIPAKLQLRLAKLLGYQHQAQYPDLDPHLQLLLAIRQLKGDTSLLSLDALKSRQHFSLEMASIVSTPTPVASVKDFSIAGPASQLPVRHYLPEQAQGAPLLVFYHGGGFIVGDIDTHDEACRILCKYGRMQVLSIDYRLAPEHPAPAAVDDCVAGLKWAHAHAAELGADPTRIAVGGDSAGGNLSTVVSQVTKGSADAPAAQLLIYPVVDQYNDYPSQKAFSEGLFLTDQDADNATTLYILSGELTLEHPLVTPMLGDMTNLAPALVVTSAYDILRDEGEAYAKRLTELGNKATLYRVADQGHGFINITSINKAAKKATIKMAQDFRNFLNELE